MGVVAFVSTRRTRITSFFEMLPSLSSDYSSYDSTSGNSSVAQSYTETYMTSLIKTVTLDKTPVVAFVDGLNVDANSSELTSILEMNGYEVRTVDVRREELPDDADIVMLAGPTSDLSKAQTAKFDSFLSDRKKSRTLIVFSTSLMPKMPHLNSLLSEYGIAITQDIVYEGDSHNTISKQMSAFTAQMKESGAGKTGRAQHQLCHGNALRRSDHPRPGNLQTANPDGLEQRRI